ncbi:MAG: hypothetical protein AAGA75_26155 [Cyanobacteria bacterium P01_E01_bin.6]
MDENDPRNHTAAIILYPLSFILVDSMVFQRVHIIPVVSLFGLISFSTPALSAERQTDRVLREHVSAQALTASLEEYIGIEHIGDDFSTFSGNLTSQGGWIVYRSGEPLEYSVSRAVDGEFTFLFFEREIGRHGARPIWEVLDVIRIPNPTTDQMVGFACAIGDADVDPEILAVVGFQDVEWIDDIQQAWRVNRQTHEIEAIDTSNIRCINHGWGL